MTRRVRWLAWSLGAVALYTIFGFWILPRIMRSQIEQRLPELLHRPVHLESVVFNPYDLSIELVRFEVTEQDGSPFFRFDDLLVDARVIDLLRGTLGFEQIRWVKPELHVGLSASGQLNFADLLVSDAPAPAAPVDKAGKKPPAVRIQALAIEGGVFSFRDDTRRPPFHAELAPIAIDVKDFSTEPERDSPYAFSARFDQESRLSWNGDISVNPLRSSGNLEISGVRLSALGPYLSELSALRVVEGTFGVKGKYRVDASQGPLVFRADDGELELDRVRVLPPQGKDPVVGLERLALRGVALDLLAHRAGVKEIALEGLEVRAERDEAGSIDLLRWATQSSTRAAAKPKAAKTSSATPFIAEIARTTVKGALHLVDRSQGAALALELTDVDLQVGPIRTPAPGPIDLDLSLGIAPKGTLAVSAHVDGSAVHAQVDLGRFPLSILEPLVEARTTGTLASGVLSAKLGLDVAPSALGIQGDLALEELSFLEAPERELVGVDALRVVGLKGGLSPVDLSIARLELVRPRARAGMNANGALNLSGLLKPTPAAPPPPPPGPDAKPARIKIDTMEIDKGAVELFDRTIKPALVTKLQGVGGKIGPIKQPFEGKTRLALTGRLDLAPMKLSGELTPRGKQSEVKLNLSLGGWDLLPIGGYVGKYAGYALDKGKLSVDLDLGLADKKLDVKNRVKVDQLTLGDKVESPDATWLPVKLALAILTDKDGLIDLDVPVTGDLDDPEFGVGRVIGRALLNILEKVATSPFALLGALVGGDQDELSEVTFDAGSAEPLPSESAKIAKVQKALGARPKLRVSVVGAVDPSRDLPVLAKAAFRRKLQGKGPPLGDAEYERRVLDLWAKDHPRTKTTTATPPFAQVEASLLAAEPAVDPAPLAEARAKAVQAALLSGAALEMERVFIGVPKAGEAGAGKSAGVSLSLE
ncbi:MAG: DUF748 domain-containing protein [Myxococcota bacterium]